jgi:hypothetical protein
MPLAGMEHDIRPVGTGPIRTVGLAADFCSARTSAGLRDLIAPTAMVSYAILGFCEIAIAPDAACSAIHRSSQAHRENPIG